MNSPKPSSEFRSRAPQVGKSTQLTVTIGSVIALVAGIWVASAGYQSIQDQLKVQGDAIAVIATLQAQLAEHESRLTAIEATRWTAKDAGAESKAVHEKLGGLQIQCATISTSQAAMTQRLNTIGNAVTEIVRELKKGN